MSTVGLIVVLASIWVMLWGTASLANVLGGLIVAAALVLFVPGLRRRGGRRPIVLRPVAIVRLVAYMLVTTIKSNIVLTREILSPGSQIRTGVIGVPLPGCSDELMTLITNLLALSPGSMPLELTSDPIVLYVHVLHLHYVEHVHRDILRLTDLTVRAFGSADAVAAQDQIRRARSTA